jgi:hypothetical protein
MVEALHTDLAAGRWSQLALAEQLANIGSEVGCAVRAKSTGNDPDAALTRSTSFS